MDTTGPPCLGHIAIAVGEPRRVAAFYRDLLDLQIVRDGGNQLTGDAVLLSGDPGREDHELMLLTNAGAEHIPVAVGRPFADAAARPQLHQDRVRGEQPRLVVNDLARERARGEADLTVPGPLEIG
jgi:catechol 2,3-dioxygenase-like lactoylglutathione lyase family enzyme